MARGKLVDTWYYSHKAIEHPDSRPDTHPDSIEDRIPAKKPIVRDRKVEISVRIMKTTEETDKAPHATKSVSFEAECKDPKILISGTDIEAIRRAVWSHLDEAYAVKWENYLLVHVRRPTSYEGIGNGLAVEWTDCEKGTAWDGTLLLREYNRGRRPGEDIYKISPWPGEFKDNKGRIQACIPATDQNKDGLHELSKRMDALREAFAKMLEPKNIQRNLANLAGVSFLPPPMEQGADEDDGEDD